MIMYARRLQPATLRAVKALGNASSVPRRSQSKFHANQTSFAFSTRTFSSSPNEGLPEATPTDALNQALDAADKIDYKSLSELGTSLSDLAIRALDIVHTTTGLPWYATIFVTTLAIRTAMFPITLKSLRNSDRMKLFQPELEKIKEEMDNQPRDPAAIANFRAKYLALKEKHQINPFLGPILPMSQIPVFLGFFWGLQEISQYFPDYASGGTLWFHDLSVADPTYALPVISSIIMISSIEAGKDALPSGWGDNAVMGMRVLGLALIPLTIKFQSGVLVYWVSSNLYTLMQTALVRVPVVRQTLNLAPLGSSVKLLKTAAGASPFNAAVARAREGTAINTHTYNPKKSKQSPRRSK